MLLERHFGQERSLSSPRSTCSWYSWPHIMQRNVSVVAMTGSLLVPVQLVPLAPRAGSVLVPVQLVLALPRVGSVPYGAAAAAGSALGFGLGFFFGLGLSASIAWAISSAVTFCRSSSICFMTLANF